MKKVLTITGKSQFDEDIAKQFQPSACGPVTAYVIMNHHFPNQWQNVNELYKRLGGTKIGLFTWRFIRNVQKLLGPEWQVATGSLDDVISEINAGRPVAAKFDKWFTWKWRGHYTFDYHWVPVIGYEKTDEDVLLIVHDNGGRHRKSHVHSVSYTKNKDILTFIKIKPKMHQHDVM